MIYLLLRLIYTMLKHPQIINMELFVNNKPYCIILMTTSHSSQSNNNNHEQSISADIIHLIVYRAISIRLHSRKNDPLVTRQQWNLVKARTGCYSSPARNVPCPTAVVSGPIRQAPVHVLHAWELLSKTATSATFLVHTFSWLT